MRSSGWPSSSVTGVLVKRRKCPGKTGTHEERTPPFYHRGRGPSDVSTSQGAPRLGSKPQKQEKARESYPLTSFRLQASRALRQEVSVVLSSQIVVLRGQS